MGKGSYIFESEVGCFVGDFEVFEDGDGAGRPAWGFQSACDLKQIK